MGDELKEIAARYWDLFNKTKSGLHQEINSSDLYVDLHVIATRILELEAGLERIATRTLELEEGSALIRHNLRVKSGAN